MMMNNYVRNLLQKLSNFSSATINPVMQETKSVESSGTTIDKRYIIDWFLNQLQYFVSIQAVNYMHSKK